MEITGRIYTREDIIHILDNNIASCLEKFGWMSCYFADARNYKYKTLEEYDAGKIVFVEREEYHEDGMDFAVLYYSDGSFSYECPYNYNE